MAREESVMRASRLLWQLWPWRWWRAAAALLRGVRMHPTVVLLGRAWQLEVGRGTVLGARVRLDLASAGRLTIGERAWLAADTEIESSTEVRIGDGTTVQRRCSLNGSVRLGRGCILAPNVFISSGTHPFRRMPHLPIRAQERLLARQPTSQDGPSDRPVWIQDDCWLGVNSVISPGVTVGKGSVVGANAVVTSSVAPYTVMAGVPAREVGRRLEWSPPREILAERLLDMPYVLSGQVAERPGASRPRVAITATEAVQVVMSPTLERIAIHVTSSQDVDVLISSGVHRLQAGDNVVQVDTQSLERTHGGILLEMKSIDWPPGVCVGVNRLRAP
jgi:acetyltransferase-like isoleucine patch superfamily enzyme